MAIITSLFNANKLFFIFLHIYLQKNMGGYPNYWSINKYIRIPALYRDQRQYYRQKAFIFGFWTFTNKRNECFQNKLDDGKTFYITANLWRTFSSTLCANNYNSFLLTFLMLGINNMYLPPIYFLLHSHHRLKLVCFIYYKTVIRVNWIAEKCCFSVFT